MHFINAGIGATGSLIGVHRAQRDVLDFSPDIVFVEFAVNDSNLPEDHKAYESLLRRILSAPKKPALILLFSSWKDGSNESAPVFIYAGSCIFVRFTGTSVGLVLRNRRNGWDNYIGFILDDRKDEKIRISEHNTVLTLELASEPEDTLHTLTIFKRQDACHSFEFLGLILDNGAGFEPPPENPDRRIECFGDSVSAGEASEALDFVRKPDPPHNGEYSNAWYSYAMITARKLRAQIHLTAQGGIALLDKTGYFRGPDTLGMLSAYDKLQYNPQLGPVTPWDFSKYTPHVVIVAIGQNDAHPENYIRADAVRRNDWKEHYKAFILNLRTRYPKALILLTTTLLQHDKGWDDCIAQARQELFDPNVLHFLYKRNGTGTPGHIRIPEAGEMADELTAFIESLGGEIWN